MRTIIGVAAMCALVAAPAAGEVEEPVDRLVERPLDWQPGPRAKPEPRDLFERECPRTPDGEVEWARVPQHLREVPLHAMIGQLLVISFSGKAPSDVSVAATAEAIGRSDIGGVLYFRHNVGSAEDVAAVNAAFGTAHPDLPAIIAIDQEGGAVMRLKPSEGAPATPSAEAIATGSVEDARAAYRAMAETLAALGFTANFGPVVDLSLNPDNPVIARFGRSYGRNPRTVVAYAEAFVAAHRDAGVATALKHFPGHGSSTADSHDGAIDLDPTWSQVELQPFRMMIEADLADMVMIGHLDLAGFSGPDGLPASLSPRAITDRLRVGMCFEGLIVSDDLAMEAISSTWPMTEAVRLMIEAGGDVALVSLPAGKGLADVRAMVDAIAADAQASPDLQARIRHAYARVVHHKLDLKRARGEASARYARAEEPN